EPTVNAAAGIPPNDTARARVNPVPVIMTFCPPASGPCDGLTPVTTGTGLRRIAMPSGLLNPVMVLVAVLITGTGLASESVPQGSRSSGLTATPTGALPTPMVAATVPAVALRAVTALALCGTAGAAEAAVIGRAASPATLSAAVTISAGSRP